MHAKFGIAQLQMQQALGLQKAGGGPGIARGLGVGRRRLDLLKRLQNQTTRCHKKIRTRQKRSGSNTCIIKQEDKEEVVNY
jgi:hypothetical protein